MVLVLTLCTAEFLKNRSDPDGNIWICHNACLILQIYFFQSSDSYCDLVAHHCWSLPFPHCLLSSYLYQPSASAYSLKRNPLGAGRPISAPDTQNLLLEGFRLLLWSIWKKVLQKGNIQFLHQFLKKKKKKSIKIRFWYNKIQLTNGFYEQCENKIIYM